jgi:putative PIN family toxin of toxin-antitoxin system
MIRVVLDTNVLLSALIVKVGKPAQIIARHDRFEFLTSEGILAELEKVLGYARIRRKYQVSDEEVRGYLARLRADFVLVTVSTSLSVVRQDPDDDKVIACAVDGGASYIVSGDPHLLDMREYEGIRIVSPADFLNVVVDSSGNS